MVQEQCAAVQDGGEGVVEKEETVGSDGQGMC